jgi:hypothetical protein
MRTHHSAASMLALLLGAVCIGLVLIWLIAVLAMMARADERPADPTTGIVPNRVPTLKYKRIAPREEQERAFKPEAAAERKARKRKRRGR